MPLHPKSVFRLAAFVAWGRHVGRGCVRLRKSGALASLAVAGAPGAGAAQRPLPRCARDVALSATGDAARAVGGVVRCRRCAEAVDTKSLILVACRWYGESGGLVEADRDRLCPAYRAV
jgi:hypothetical protein